MRAVKRSDVFHVILFSVVVPFFYLLKQNRIVAGGGLGWDGIEYNKIYDFFVAGASQHIEFPFCFRVGAPFLASQLPGVDVFEAFKYLNLISSILLIFISYVVALRLGFTRVFAVFAMFIFGNLLFAPARFSSFYPVYSDPVFMVLELLSVWAAFEARFNLAYILMVLAVPFREVAVYIMPLMLFAEVVVEKPDYVRALKRFFVFMSLAVFVKWLIGFCFDCSGSQFNTALGWLFKSLGSPERFLAYCAAISMTIAPLVFLKVEDSYRFRVSVFGLLMALVLALVGGSDITRVFYQMLPMYFYLILLVMKQSGGVFLAVSVLGYVLTNRIGHKILEPLNYWPNRDESGMFWMFPDHARIEVSLMILAVWVILFFGYNQRLKLLRT